MPSITDSDRLPDDEFACEYLIGQEGNELKSAFDMIDQLKNIFSTASSAQFFYPSNESFIKVQTSLSDEGFVQEKANDNDYVQDTTPNLYGVRPWLITHLKIPNE